MRALLVAAIGGLAGAAAALAVVLPFVPSSATSAPSSSTSSRPPSSSLVYVCPHQPCRYAQELQVSDPGHAPIFAAGEYGPVAAYGTPLAVFRRGEVIQPSIVVSYGPPTVWGCLEPSEWLAPGPRGLRIWYCRGGRWRR